MLRCYGDFMKLNEHLEKLRYFYEVANCKSMRRASEKVFITQPSLSKSIKLLEEVVGSELFIRLPRGVKLTEEGAILYKYCHELFNSLENLELKLEHGNDPMAGSLRIGTYDSIGIYFWPDFLRSFIPEYPNLSLEISTGRSSDMQEKLLNGEVDIALIINPKAHKQLEIRNIYEDSFKFYELAKGKKVYADLEEAPLITMPDSFSAAASLDEVLSKMGNIKRKTYQTSSLESAKELCLKGLGIGLLPELVVHSLMAQKKVKEVKVGKGTKGLFPHKISAAFHKSRKKSVLVNQVIDSIESSFHSQLLS